MFNVLYEKIKQDEANSDTEREASALEDLEKMLVQTKTVMDLLFMNEVSQLITCAPSNSNALMFFLLKQCMPSTVWSKIFMWQENHSWERNHQKLSKLFFQVRKPSTAGNFFNSPQTKFVNPRTSKNIPLLLPGGRERVTRSSTVYRYDKQAYMILVHNRFQKYTYYLGELIDSLKQRFEP